MNLYTLDVYPHETQYPDSATYRNHRRSKSGYGGLKLRRDRNLRPLGPSKRIEFVGTRAEARAEARKMMKDNVKQTRSKNTFHNKSVHINFVKALPEGAKVVRKGAVR